MAAAIPFVIGKAAAWLLPAALASTVIVAGLTVGAAFAAGVSLVVGSAMARRAQKKAARAAPGRSATDVKTTIRSATAPTQTIYGRTLVGGVIPFWFTSGDVGQFHHWAQVLASHQIDGIDSWIINDTPVTVDGAGWVTTEQFCRVATSTTWVDGPPIFWGFDEWGNPIHGANPVQQTTRTVTPLIRLRVYDGTQTTLDADILSASAGAMSIGDCGRGLAWVAVRFEADHDIFGQIGAPTIRAVVRGKRLFDPRTGLTAWTDNAALCALDYLQGEHGLRCLPAEINTASIIAAANVCDEQVPIAGGSQARYTINGAIGSDVGLRDNLESLVDAMAGMAVWVQGRWRVMAGAYAPPLRTLTESDIQQVESLVAYTPRREIFNTINGTFIDSSTLWVERQYPQVTNPGYVTQDGGQVIERQIDQPLVIDPIRAQRLAKIEIERARQAVTVQLLCKWTAYDLAPGDHVALSLARYGWASKVFFVASRELSSEGVRYVMRETAPGVWAWAMGEATVGDLAPNTALPNPFIPPPPLTGLAAASGTSELQVAQDGGVISRIRLSWAASPDAAVRSGGHIEIEYRVMGTPAWAMASIGGNENATHLWPVLDGAVYELRARAVSVLGQRGQWASIAHQVVGKTEPPPDVAGFRISGDELRWEPVQALDLAGYQIRFQHGNNPWWPTATPLHSGTITDSPWVMLDRPVGPVTLMLRAVDTTGNLSRNAAIIITDLGDALVANVLLERPQQPTWPGAHNGVILGGALVGAATDLFFGPAQEPFFDQDHDPFFAAATFASLQYEFDATIDTTGRLVLQHQISAPSYTIDYRRDNQLPFFGIASDSFFGPGAEPFFGAPGAWMGWPGSLQDVQGDTIRFRVSAQGGATRPTFTTLSAILDVPDIVEQISDAPIAAAGSRLPILRTYRTIKHVQLTLQGTTGRTVRVLDKSTAGPLVQALDAAGAGTSAVMDATVQGF